MCIIGQQFSCGKYECNHCFPLSFANHPDRKKVLAWNNCNKLAPINYFMNDMSEVYFTCFQCQQNFKMKIDEASKHEITCTECLRKQLYKKIKIKNMASNKNFICKECNIGYRYEYQLDKHKETQKHLEKINNSVFKCNKCKYETNIKSNYNVHILNNHSTLEERKKGFDYYCLVCDVGKPNKKEYEKHNKTQKHIQKTKQN